VIQETDPILSTPKNLTWALISSISVLVDYRTINDVADLPTKSGSFLRTKDLNRPKDDSDVVEENHN